MTDSEEKRKMRSSVEEPETFCFLEADIGVDGLSLLRAKGRGHEQCGERWFPLNRRPARRARAHAEHFGRGFRVCVAKRARRDGFGNACSPGRAGEIIS